LPGSQDSQGRVENPDYGAAEGSARLTGEPWGAVLTGSAQSSAGKRNASSATALQRYSNDTDQTQTVTLNAVLVSRQTVPEENAAFPEQSGAHTRSPAELLLFRISDEMFEAGESAEENWQALMDGTPAGFQPLAETRNTHLSPTTTHEGQEIFTLCTQVEPGEQVWFFGILQTLSANGSEVEAELTTRLDLDSPCESRGLSGSFLLNSRFIGILGLLAIGACWSLAFVLFRVGTPGSMARILSILLIFEGLTLVTAGFPEFALGLGEQLIGNDVWGAIMGISHFLADGAMLSLYPAFLAAALLTPLTRPFSGKKARVVLWILGMGIALGTILTYGFLGWNKGTLMLYAAMTFLFVYGFIAAIDAYRQADPGLAKTRAGIFVIAFGIRDISWGFVYGASAWMTLTESFSYTTQLFWEVKLVYALGTLIAVPLIAYGILRTHLFDIDLKVRWTIKQSSFAAMVVLITFAVSEGVEMVVAAELGDKWGLVAAGVAVVFLKPLQSAAERVVSLIMPNTQNTPAYKQTRKTEVYEAAYAEAAEEGDISDKERALLDRLRDTLELSPDQASAIEARVMA
jgi:hypothetical protein